MFFGHIYLVCNLKQKIGKNRQYCCLQLGMLNFHLFEKELLIRFTVCVFREQKIIIFCRCVFPVEFEDVMSDLIA